jgi:hypothetical protein
VDGEKCLRSTKFCMIGSRAPPLLGLGHALQFVIVTAVSLTFSLPCDVNTRSDLRKHQFASVNKQHIFSSATGYCYISKK